MGEFDHIARAMQASPLTAAFAEMAVSHDFSRLDRNTAKRQHFLPQFLLRGFSCEHRAKHFVFQMDAEGSEAPLRVPVRTAASRRRLYAGIDDEGHASNRNEGYLALVETHAKPALSRLIDQPGDLAPGDRATIAIFIALQLMRSPAAEAQVTALANAAFRTAAGELFSDRRRFAARHRERFDAGASEEEIERLRVEAIEEVRSGRVRLNGTQGAAFATGLRAAIDNVPMLLEFDWTLVRAPRGGFITSDRGYAIHDPTPPYPWASQGLLSSPNTQTTLPLSDTVCLLVRPVPMGGALNEHEASSHDVETINLRTYGWAKGYVYARSEKTLTEVRMAAGRRPTDVIRPKVFCQVALLEPDPEDDSLAEANICRGWPARLRKRSGAVRDYVVILSDKPDPDLLRLVDELTETRARKRAGIGPDEPFERRIANHPVDPLDVFD